MHQTGLCTRQNVSDQLWAYASAVMLGLSEQAAEKGDSSAESLFKKVEDGDNVEDHDDDLGNDEDDLSADDNEQNSAADEVREEIDKARFERTDL